MVSVGYHKAAHAKRLVTPAALTVGYFVHEGEGVQLLYVQAASATERAAGVRAVRSGASMCKRACRQATALYSVAIAGNKSKWQIKQVLGDGKVGGMSSDIRLLSSWIAC